MKTFLISVVMAFAGTFSVLAAESHVVEFKIVGGGTNLPASSKIAMENNVVNLLTMMSDAQARGSKTLNFSGIAISQEARSTILQLWKYQPLRVWTDDEEVTPLITENLLKINALQSYQVRNIPVRLFPVETPGKDKYSQVSVTFSAKGTIEDFNITIERQQYDKLIKDAQTVQDLENRKMLAYWMDQLKMAYESQDLNYLHRLFDKDAVIITGVRSSKNTGVETKFKAQETFDYYVKNREQYMASLEKVFDNNKEIHVNFLNQEYGCNETALVTDRNGEKMPRYYMVWCTQEWNGSSYSDVGRLFVLWDFKNPDQPLIMARAWTAPTDPKQFSCEDFELNQD